MDSNYPSDWSSRQKKVKRRDNHQCQNCGALGGSRGEAELHAHHGVPISKGGSHRLGNLTTYCKDCHRAIHIEDRTAPTTTGGFTPFEQINCPNCGGNGLENQGYSLDSLVNIQCSDCRAKFKTTRDWRNDNSWVLVEGKQELRGLSLSQEEWESLNQLRLDLSSLEREVHSYAQEHLQGEIVRDDEEVDIIDRMKESQMQGEKTLLNPDHEVWEEYLKMNSPEDTSSKICAAFENLEDKNLIETHTLEDENYENSQSFSRLVVKGIPTESDLIKYANEIGERVEVANGKMTNQQVDPMFVMALVWVVGLILIVAVGTTLI